jgi:hypothetical protein
VCVCVGGGGLKSEWVRGFGQARGHRGAGACGLIERVKGPSHGQAAPDKHLRPLDRDWLPSFTL